VNANGPASAYRDIGLTCETLGWPWLAACLLATGWTTRGRPVFLLQLPPHACACEV
jgi:hypothetical protein